MRNVWAVIIVLVMSVPVLADVTVFSDNFDRSAVQENDIDAIDAGMSGLASPVTYIERGDDVLAGNAGLTNIENNRLHVADGANMTVMYPVYNFTNTEILAAGGMRVGLTITSNDGTATDLDRYCGFGVGNTLNECETANFDYNDVGFRGRVNNYAGTSDLWIGWSPVGGGTIQLFKNGPTSEGGENYDIATGVALTGNDRLEMELAITGFDAGSTVAVDILWNSTVIHSTTFQWDNSNANYIGLSARQNDQGFTVDDFEVIATTPEVIPILTDLTAAPDTISDSSTEQVTLAWSATMVQGQDTYAVTADKAVVFPNGDNTGTASNGQTSIVADVDGTLGDVEFIVTLYHNAEAVSTRTTTVRAMGPSLLDFTATPNEVDDDATTPVVLTWDAVMVDPGITYAVTADKTVTYPGGDDTGPAVNGQTSVTANVDGASGDVRFTITLLDDSIPVDSKTALVDVISMPDPNAPNVIVILLDDTGWSDIGCYGSEIQTPNIDSLAAGGVRFRNFYQAARCAPTRIALLSGLYTQQAAVDPSQSLPNLTDHANARANNVTIAEVLAEGGYRTYTSGKWHLGLKSNNRDPLSRGFMHAFGQGINADGSNSTGAFGYWLEGNYHVVSTNNEIPQRQYGSKGIQFHYADAVGDYSVDFIDHSIKKSDGKPFFLYIPFNSAHWPVCAPAEIANKYTDVGDPNPGDTDVCLYEQGWDVIRQQKYNRQLGMGVIDNRFLLTPKGDNPSPVTPIPDWNTLDSTRQMDLARRQAVYAAMIDQVDINIGKVINKLKSEGLFENTLIFFCCDNGANYEGGLYGNTSSLTGLVWDPDHLDSMGQPENAENTIYPRVNQGGGWANMSNTPFRLFKHFTHDGGIRTAAILHWPAKTNPSVAGTWTEQRGHLIDVMATVVDATGANYPNHYAGHSVLPMEGTSLLPVLTGQKLRARDIAVEHESNRAFFRGKYKLTTKNFSFSDGSSPADELELYDMSQDPTEMNNLIGSQPELLREMIIGWDAWAARVGVPSARWLTVPPPEPNLPEPDYASACFQDLYNRADNNDIDAETDGMSGSLSPITYMETFEPSGSDSIQINNDRLQMATTNEGMSSMYLDHNFIDASILAKGGFTVMLDVLNINGGDDPANRFGGFGIGLSEAEAAAAGDIINGPTALRPTADGSGATVVSDFYIDLALDGVLRAWSGNTLISETTVVYSYGRIRVDFLFPDFAAGDTVIARIYFDDVVQDVVSFNWDHNDQNYIGLSARASNYVQMDNLVIMPFESFTVYNANMTGGDDIVNLSDFAILAAQWLSGYTAPCPAADLSGDCFVDMEDMSMIGLQWLTTPD